MAGCLLAIMFRITTDASMFRLTILIHERAFQRGKGITDDERRSMQLGIDPKNCVVVEDAAAGVQAARLAGDFIPNSSSSAITHLHDGSSGDSLLPA